MPVLDAPVRPAREGTYPFADNIAATYTAGLDPSVRMLKKILRRTTVLGCDIESYGLGLLAHRLKCVTFSDITDSVVLDPRDPAQARIIRFAFAHCAGLIFHNSTFDVPILCSAGLMQTSDIAKVWDTLIYARFVEADPRVKKSLLALTEKYFGHAGGDMMLKAFKMLGLNKSQGYHDFDLDRPQYLMGAAIDAIMTARLFPILRQAALDRTTRDHPFSSRGVIGAEAERLVDREQVINRMLLRRTVRGFVVDFDYLESYRDKVAIDQDRAEKKLAELGIRPGVGNDLTAWLEKEGAIPEDHPKTKGTEGKPETRRWSSTADDLALIDHPVARLFVEHKKRDKILTDYLEKVRDHADEHGRIHPEMNIFGAEASGRMSMSNPPLQQFPEDARPILLSDSPKGMTSIDWSQIEPALAANLCGEHKLLQRYEAGVSDLYVELGIAAGKLPAATTTADCETGEKKKIRGQMKTRFLAKLYGTGLAETARSLNLSIKEATVLVQQMDDAMPKITAMDQKLRMIGKRYHKIVTLSGRILTVPVGPSKWDPKRYSVMAHKAVNYTYQGGAYDVLAEALISCEEQGYGDAVDLPYHDEIYCDTEAADDIRRIMQTPPPRLIELAQRQVILRTDRVDLGRSWRKV